MDRAVCVDYSVVGCFDYSYCFGACVDAADATDERAHYRHVDAAVVVVAGVARRFGWRGRLKMEEFYRLKLIDYVYLDRQCHHCSSASSQLDSPCHYHSRVDVADVDAAAAPIAPVAAAQYAASPNRQHSAALHCRESSSIHRHDRAPRPFR